MAKLHFRSYTTNQMVLFPQRIDENIAENDPVRIVSSIVDHLDMSSVNKLYNGMGRCPYHPRMMLKVIIYAYMNNIYSCRRIEQLLLRDIHFIWLAGYEKPDFITINRFRNRLKDEINNIFTQLVLVLAEKGFVSLDVEYVDGTKIESKANKYTFVWRKTVERNRARLIDKVKALLAQVDDCIAQDNTKTDETVEFTPSQLAEISAELNASLSDPQVEMDKEEKKKRRKLAKELKERSEKLAEYNQHLETLGDRNSYSKTDKDATFMHMKEDAINDGLTKPGYNLQIATENQFITNFALFPNPTDTLTYIPFMESFRERYGHFASTEVADSGYGSEENYEFMELNGTAAYVKYNRFHIEHRPQYVPDPFRSENFYYNKKEDYCVCPMGQHMTRTGTSHKTSASGYVSNRATYTAQNCEGCPLRCLCFDASGDRRVIDRNHKQEAYRQKASELLTSEEGLRHRGKRCIEPEAVFGQIKYNMAYRRFRHIGVDKVKMDFAFFAIAFNIKKMVAKMTKGGLFSYLRAYLTNITPYKLFIRLFFVEKQKLVVHPHKNVQRVFFIYIGSFDTPSRVGLHVERHKSLCPFHDDHRPSLTFHARSNTFRCFSCGARGGPIDLVMGRLGMSFPEACRWLDGDVRIDPLPLSRPRPREEAYKPFDAARYARFFEHPWLSAPARQFLFQERRLDPRVVAWCRLTSWTDRHGTHWLQTPYYDPQMRLVGLQNRNLDYKKSAPAEAQTTSRATSGMVSQTDDWTSSRTASSSEPMAQPRFRFPQGSRCGLYNQPVLLRLRPG